MKITRRNKQYLIGFIHLTVRISKMTLDINPIEELCSFISIELSFVLSFFGENSLLMSAQQILW